MMGRCGERKPHQSLERPRTLCRGPSALEGTFCFLWTLLLFIEYSSSIFKENMHNKNILIKDKSKMVKNPNQVIVLEDNVMFMDWVPDVIGCVGTIIILIAYILLQTRKLDAHHVLFSFLNLLGALM